MTELSTNFNNFSLLNVTGNYIELEINKLNFLNCSNFNSNSQISVQFLNKDSYAIIKNSNFYNLKLNILMYFTKLENLDENLSLIQY